MCARRARRTASCLDPFNWATRLGSEAGERLLDDVNQLPCAGRIQLDALARLGFRPPRIRAKRTEVEKPAISVVDERVFAIDLRRVSTDILVRSVEASHPGHGTPSRRQRSERRSGSPDVRQTGWRCCVIGRVECRFSLSGIGDGSIGALPSRGKARNASSEKVTSSARAQALHCGGHHRSASSWASSTIAASNNSSRGDWAATRLGRGFSTSRRTLRLQQCAPVPGPCRCRVR